MMLDRDNIVTNQIRRHNRIPKAQLLEAAFEG